MYGKESRRRTLRACRLLIPLLLLVLVSACGVQPYNSKFKCPPTYAGMCESLEDAYMDSVAGLDPRMFDEEWVEKRKAWEKKNAELLKARQEAGIEVQLLSDEVKSEIASDRREDSRKDREDVSASEIDGSSETAETENEKASKAADVSYRSLVFRELRELLTEPEPPFVVPPKVVRILVLSNLAKDENGRDFFISPRYIYFMLDEPRFIIHKYDEPVPFDPENPFVLR